MQTSQRSHARTVALVPLNALTAAKTRLRGALAQPDRRALVAWLARHVVTTLRDSGVIDRIVVVSPDPAALALFASERRVTRLLSGAGELNADLELARLLPRAWGAERALVVLADLPLLSGAAVHTMLAQITTAQSEHRAAVVLAPDRHEQGTNALLVTPVDALPFAFGEGSLARHLALARRAGIEPLIYRAEATNFDVDTPADLHELVVRELWRPLHSGDWPPSSDPGRDEPREAVAGGEHHGGA